MWQRDGTVEKTRSPIDAAVFAAGGYHSRASRGTKFIRRARGPQAPQGLFNYSRRNTRRAV